MICGKIRTLFFSEAQYCILIWGKWRELTTLLIINQILRTVKGQLHVKKKVFMWITRSLCIFLLMLILVKISKIYLVVYKSESLTDIRQMLPLWFRSERGRMEPKMRKTSVSHAITNFMRSIRLLIFWWYYIMQSSFEFKLHTATRARSHESSYIQSGRPRVLGNTILNNNG